MAADKQLLKEKSTGFIYGFQCWGFGHRQEGMRDIKDVLSVSGFQELRQKTLSKDKRLFMANEKPLYFLWMVETNRGMNESESVVTAEVADF